MIHERCPLLHYDSSFARWRKASRMLSWEEFAERLTQITGRVQKAVVRDGNVGFEVFSEKQKSWLCLSAKPLGAGLYRPRSDDDSKKPSAFQGLLRKHVVNGRFTGVTLREGALALSFQGKSQWTLVLEFPLGDVRLVFLNSKNVIVHLEGSSRSKDERDLRRGKPYVFPAPARPSPFPQKQAKEKKASTTLSKKISRERKRLKRSILNLKKDLAKHGDPQRHAAMGEAFKSHMHDYRRGMKEIQGDVLIQLDPTKNAKENLEKFFAKKKRAERGIAHIAPRLQQQEERARLLEDIALLKEYEQDLAFAEYQNSMPALGSGIRRRQAEKNTSQKTQKRAPYRSFKSESGALIRVGRSAKDSDELTFHVAKAYDFWLHARDVKGSHVIVSAQKGKRPQEVTLNDAALLAAWFSAKRGEARTEVQIARRRHVKKPGKGAAAGFVFVHDEEVRLCHFDQKRVQWLIARET